VGDAICVIGADALSADDLPQALKRLLAERRGSQPHLPERDGRALNGLQAAEWEKLWCEAKSLTKKE